MFVSSSLAGLLKRFPSCFCPCICIRGLCTAATTGKGENGGREEGARISERIQHQMLLAGLNFLKGDVHSLRENLARRAAAVDIEKLVRRNPCMHVANTSLSQSQVSFLP